ncbi:hypothetical protein [Desulfobacca acetoxidans]|uniref:Uncharacterized protein n=1 Tax=Desulfobacca acetoxidans (strain ATCC 700848 / DSM 11109 / ASRB2) TaxID=880072 RepID=F2NCS0_DESAR|nr:hypothetical protein [Desulfobacca acetoxidans]AEB09351.1 hypothetical protein Desac_1496 [Desulfobacca acetoxidans DSM 11109]
MNLSGKKTYFVAGLIAAAVFARIAGFIDDRTYEAILGILGALGLGALRAGVTKVLQ